MARKSRKPERGLRFNNGKLKWHLVHFKSLHPMIQVLMYGAHKYSIFKNKRGNIVYGKDVTPEYAAKHLTLIESGADNWKKGLDLKEILNSNIRHITAILDGEEIDPETGQPHIGHAMCNNMFYSYFTINGKS